jgi:hypothetical protein
MTEGQDMLPERIVVSDRSFSMGVQAYGTLIDATELSQAPREQFRLCHLLF